METLIKIFQKLFIFEKAPQTIGLSQLKENNSKKISNSPSLRKKDVKLSDLMRRAG